jgi:hypothetical protein
LSVFGIVIALLCYSAVSPRTLPAIEYNEKFYENLKIVSLMMIAPLLTFLMVFDPKENDINKAVNAFYMAFTLGYGVTFLLQIVLTTVIRLGIFSWFEPDIFQLTPEVPTLVLPWVLRENRYRPKRITLFAADFATSCVASPIIEEYIKLKIVQWSVRLPRCVSKHGRNCGLLHRSYLIYCSCLHYTETLNGPKRHRRKTKRRSV